jgi:hypothetical protein
MVAAWWLATATAWAAAPAAGHAAQATHVRKAQTSAHKKGAKKSGAVPHAGRTGRSAKSAKAPHSGHGTQHNPHTPRQASAHKAVKPIKPAAVHPASRHRLMVDAPAPSSATPSVPVKRAIPQPHELPPILS